MRRVLVLKFCSSMIVAGVALASHSAQAREITDREASKLTLDALTATPVYHHVTARHGQRSASVHQVAAHHHLPALSRRALVHTVSYHAKASAVTHHRARHRA